MEGANQAFQQRLDRGEGACWLQDGQVLCNVDEAGNRGKPFVLATVQDVTAARGGLLRHNLQNALGAVLLTRAMGIANHAISEGLLNFKGDESDNPGRGNWFERGGIHVVVDFAHNEHGLRSLVQSVQAIKPQRVIMTIGQAGDRSDESIRSMTQAALLAKPEMLLIYELPGYERGRDIGMPPAVIRDEARNHGMQDGQLINAPNPLAATQMALSEARPGDVLVLLALTQRKEILRLVRDFAQG